MIKPKLKASDHVRISKYKKTLAKGYVPNWSQEVFVIKKGLAHVIKYLNGEEIIQTFYEKYCKNQIKHVLGLKK